MPRPPPAPKTLMMRCASRRLEQLPGELAADQEAFVPSALKSMWSTPRHGVETDLTSAKVCASRKSSRWLRSATTIA
jgi:hypothetical protein